MEMNWYVQERVEWKHNLRAELHRNFVLKKKIFQRLALFYVQRKTQRVKTTIAEIMFEKNFKKRMFKSTFDRWKHYSNLKIAKKLKQLLADQYFNNNIKLQRLQPYFLRWSLYSQNRRVLKLKMEESYRYYQTKLKGRVFNAFFSYITHRRLRKNQIRRVREFYAHKLKQKMFNKLVSYKIYKSLQRDQCNFANNFYRKKLLRCTMKCLWKNLQRRLYKRERLDIFSKRKCQRMKGYYFSCWKLFVHDNKLNKQKFLMARELFDYRCRKKYFRKLKLYRLYKRRKKQYQNAIIQKIKYIFDRRIIVICFNNWKCYTYKKRIKKQKILLSQMNYELLLKKIFFRFWIHYKNYKKMKRRRILDLELSYYRKTLERNFNIWKSITNEKRIFELKKVEAKKYYQQCLVRTTFKLIITSAFQEKDYKLDNFLENEKRRLIIAQKYMKLWRTNAKSCGVINKISRKEIDLNKTDNSLLKFVRKRDCLTSPFIESLPENFIWDPICFARPRIPEYMKK